MSTNINHFLGIGGRAAEQVEAVCARLTGRRIEDGLGGDWPKRTLDQSHRLCQRLLDHARLPPVLTYSCYLDGYSMCASQLRTLPWPGGERREVIGGTYSFTYLAPSNRAFHLRQIARDRRKYRGGEPLSFHDHVDDALRSLGWCRGPRLVVIIAECIGGSREDFEVHAALERPLPLRGKFEPPAPDRRESSLVVGERAPRR